MRARRVWKSNKVKTNKRPSQVAMRDLDDVGGSQSKRAPKISAPYPNADVERSMKSQPAALVHAICAQVRNSSSQTVACANDGCFGVVWPSESIGGSWPGARDVHVSPVIRR